MLEVERLSKSYARGEPAVRDLSFAVPPGSIVTLLGHNGAGKSTTLKIVAGILAPTSGCVRVNGATLATKASDVDLELRRCVGFLPETGQVLDYMTPREFLWYVGQLYGIEDERVLQDRVTTFVKLFSIEESEERLVRELSAGQRRRVSIIAALINQPRLLVLDEPTNFLDPIGVKMLKAYLTDQRLVGCAALLATHRLDIAEQLSDRVIVLDHGASIFDGTLEELRGKFPMLSGAPRLEDLYSALVGN
jgi:ABC-2 type transport system ATP-binding protein